jgi:hypothetical protein
MHISFYAEAEVADRGRRASDPGSKALTRNLAGTSRRNDPVRWELRAVQNHCGEKGQIPRERPDRMATTRRAFPPALIATRVRTFCRRGLTDAIRSVWKHNRDRARH